MNILRTISRFFVVLVLASFLVIVGITAIPQKTPQLGFMLNTITTVPSAEAVTVKRMDLWAEKIIQSVLNRFHDWVENYLSSLININSLDDLINLPNKLKSLVKNFDLGDMMKDILGGVMSDLQGELFSILENSIGDLLNEKTKDIELGGLGGTFRSALGSLLKGGDLGKAADMIIKGIQNKAIAGLDEAISEAVGSFKNSDKLKNLPKNTGRPDPEGTLYGDDPYTGNNPDLTTYNGESVPRVSMAELRELADKSGKGITTSIQSYVSTYPMSQPAAQTTAAIEAVKNITDEANRDLFALNIGEKSKLPIVTQIISIMSKYLPQDGAGSQSKFDELMDQFTTQNQDIANEANKSFSSGGDGDALRYIAGMQGTMLKQVALQNAILMNINRTLVDEIKLIEQLALMQTEGYARDVSSTMIDMNNAYKSLIGTFTR